MQLFVDTVSWQLKSHSLCSILYCTLSLLACSKMNDFRRIKWNSGNTFFLLHCSDLNSMYSCSLSVFNFAVCTAQFVVMFTSSYSEENCVCNAYISQSTRGLRSSLKEHVRWWLDGTSYFAYFFMVFFKHSSVVIQLVLAYLVFAVTLLQSADTMLLVCDCKNWSWSSSGMF